MHRLSALFTALLALALVGLAITPVFAQDATPAPGGEVVDPSECRVEPRPMEFFQQLAGTPGVGEATPTGAMTGSPAAGQQPQGEPADEATIGTITATYRELIACLNGGDFLRAYALYTDDYLRRNLTQEGLQRLTATPVPVQESARVAFGGVRDAVMLPDGRVGAVVDVASPVAGGTSTTYTVFAQTGDRWLIDEETVVETPAASTPAA